MIEHVERYSRAIEAARTDDEFQTWFNRATDARHARANGFWDFAVHIATPAVRFHLGNPHDKVALEIGCGGGRMLAAASYFFRQVIGLDIHTSMDRVSRELEQRGIRNCSVVSGDGRMIPLPDGSVDFVYSFIVFHHLQSFGAFQSYVRESYRCLKPGGLALLYYGKAQKTKECVDYQPNAISLEVSRLDAVLTAEKAGFSLIEEGESWRFHESALRRGYQGSMLLKR